MSIYLANRSHLYRIAYGIVRRPECAEDIVQDSYLRVAELSPVAVVKQPLHYCCQVVRNLALDYCRRQKLERMYCEFDEHAEAALSYPSLDMPHRNVENTSVLMAVDSALSRLPERTRKVFEMYRIEGKTQRQIAADTGRALGLINALIADADRSLDGCRQLMAR
ncbi:sigma-70 family RNA polymerase sigma factor [Bordetella ansorpii]|uniref:sigma-70 family RNA polymerase sigma factor n=1 Tax=Bordetella ansorpii TaxID=288768 RepID=UPI001F1F7538|nr:sigma-70 family RNA polymerase sigma factor [Bordetella ansorpii]